MSDEALAAVINHILVAWGDTEAFPLIRTEEVRQERAKALSPGQVWRERPVP